MKHYNDHKFYAWKNTQPKLWTELWKQSLAKFYLIYFFFCIVSLSHFILVYAGILLFFCLRWFSMDLVYIKLNFVQCAKLYFYVIHSYFINISLLSLLFCCFHNPRNTAIKKRKYNGEHWWVLFSKAACPRASIWVA